jgi:hypothetical protein
MEESFDLAEDFNACAPNSPGRVIGSVGTHTNQEKFDS